jgi:hypothetical protein
MIATAVILFIGSFWEASMDAIGTPHNYEASIWRKIASYFDKRGISTLGNQFWDNRLAWRNKWKNGNPNDGERFLGSSTFLVMLMDGWHVVKAIWLFHLFFALVLYNPYTSSIFIDLGILMFIFCTGHELFFRAIQYKLFKA